MHFEENLMKYTVITLAYKMDKELNKLLMLI